MKYTCKKCRQEISVQKDELKQAEKRNWECLNCWTVIATNRYPKIPTMTTVFSNLGKGLGDKVLSENLLSFYREQNPSEKIVVLKKTLSANACKTKYRYSKYFISNVNDNALDVIPSGKTIYWFNLNTEIKEIFSNGRELRLWFKPIKPKLTTDELISLKNESCVIVHARHICKNGDKLDNSKNMTKDEFQSILNMIWKYNKIPVLVGNDKEIPGINYKQKYFDFRNKLTLEEIAWILKRGILYIGRDSGMLHVASCINGLPLIAYNFVQDTWKPFTTNSHKFFNSRKFDFKDLINEIEFRLWNRANKRLY